jgi:hypothetical protein
MLQEQDANHLATDGTLHLFFGSYDRTADVMERIEQIIIVAAHACKLPIKCDSCPPHWYQVATTSAHVYQLSLRLLKTIRLHDMRRLNTMF